MTNTIRNAMISLPPQRRQTSGTTAAGRYSERRWMTSAALTMALSPRNGREPWPGVPLERNVHQWTPFSATTTGSLGPPADATDAPRWLSEAPSMMKPLLPSADTLVNDERSMLPGNSAP